MAKKPVNALQAKLGTTLDKIAQLPATDPAPTSEAGAEEPIKPLVVRGKRTSINVFDGDLELLDPLRDFLRQRTGTRVIRDSTLIQVLCRCFEPNDATVAAFREVTGLDQRRKA